MPRRAEAYLGLIALALIALAPASASAQGERVMLGVETALAVPTAAPTISPFAPGASASLAAHFSVTNWLMPLVRVRAAVLGAGDSTTNAGSALGTLGSVTAGIRFRPRGIAHPEEPSRAACVWAEVDAGAGLFDGRALPSFEAAVGFLFVAGEVDLGPVVRFLHVLPIAAGDGSDLFLVTVGLEVLIGDAR